ncbi:MAG: hypothetical protein LBH80_07460 [Prevotellaceae bacterium]|jgi:hypothetical protein|nr:hypothetical protein [Prevotellaceae bacterium]
MNQVNLKQKRRDSVRFNILLLLAVFLCVGATTRAQVSIGTAEAPVAGALLQLKEKKNVLNDSLNAYKGLLLPRVTLSDKNQLFPMFLANPDNPASGPNTTYASDKTKLDKIHTGLVVYNLTEDKSKDLCLGLNQWNGKEWVCFQHEVGNAVGHLVSCNDLNIFGRYKSPNAHPVALHPDDESLDGSNYITLKLEITEPGAYNITVTPEYASAANGETNGYFFSDDGIFWERGVHTIMLRASGVPFWYTPVGSQGDKLTVMMNGKTLTLNNGTPCTKNIVVENFSKKPNYTIDCSQKTVHGTYLFNRPLNPQENYLSIWIEMNSTDTSVQGATVYLETDEVDGISFASIPTTITFADRIAGRKEIILRGKGKPTSAKINKMTVSSNSATGKTTCSVDVMVVYAKTKILGIGNTSTYGYNIADQNGNVNMSQYFEYGACKVLKASLNFGKDTTSLVKVDSLLFVDVDIPNAGDLQNLIDNHEPDIIVMAYNYRPTDVTTFDALDDYLQKNGVVIAAIEDTNTAELLFRRTLKNNAITCVSYKPFGTIYTFRKADKSRSVNLVNDELLNGPFGDVREKYWGEDASLTAAMTNVPDEDVIVYSDGRFNNMQPAPDEEDMITICRFKDRNLVWIGDGGFWAAGLNDVEIKASANCPFYYDDDFKPVPKLFGNTFSTDIHNSIFFANMMSWAIKTAQLKGFNTP